MGAPQTVQAPADPDPTPNANSTQGQDALEAARRQRQKIANMNGRNKTILAGTTPAVQQAQKTNILGS